MNRLYLRNNDKGKLRANETRLRSLARSKSASCFVKRAVFWTKMGGLKIRCHVRQLSRIDAVKTKKKSVCWRMFLYFFIFYPPAVGDFVYLLKNVRGISVLVSIPSCHCVICLSRANDVVLENRRGRSFRALCLSRKRHTRDHWPLGLFFACCVCCV